MFDMVFLLVTFCFSCLNVLKDLEFYFRVLQIEQLFYTVALIFPFPLFHSLSYCHSRDKKS